MNLINPAQTPLQHGRYVPYFYDSGGFLQYGLAGKSPSLAHSYRSDAVYDFSSSDAPWQRFDHPQTVEQVIARGYFAVPKDDSETPILGDKKHTAGLGLDDVITQIRQRYQIYGRNMYELDLAVCEAGNEVHRIEADRGQPANDDQRGAAHKRTADLYEQKRAERVNLWRDVSRTRQLIPETAQQYLATYRKLSILEDVGGDGR